MTKIVYFEYCALIIEILIINSVYKRGLTRGRVNRWYLAIITTILAATTSDIVGMTLEMMGPGYVLGKYISNAVCLWCTAAACTLLCCYLFAQTGLWYTVRHNKKYSILFFIPMVIYTALVIFINPFCGIIFYIDDNGMYARGFGVLLLYSMSFIYIIVGACVVVIYRRIYPLRKALSTFLLLGSSILATLIQFFFPNVIIQMFVTAVAALILLLEVQAPEERLHPGTGFFSENAYVQDIRNLFAINIHFDVVLAVMTNYEALSEMLGYFGILSYIRILSSRMKEFVKDRKLDLDIYYIGNGRFAFIGDERYLERVFEIAQGINAIVTEEYNVNDICVIGMTNVCAIRCPEDIDNAEHLFACDEKLLKEGYSGEIRYGEKLFDRQAYIIRRDFGKILDRAFSDDNFSVVYQPVYDARVKRFVCAEAFLRLNDPEFGYIEPLDVIKRAEKSSAIHAITAYVVEEACKFISQPDFLLLGLDFIEINLSPIQCMWSDLLAVVLATLRAYNVQPKSICFDIVDIDEYSEYSKMKNNLEALSQVGFKLVMDDFGAGIFEIERVAELPLMGIKLDRKFSMMGLREENEGVLKGTIRLINDMDIAAAAVGIEDEEMEKKFIGMGCDILQGYHYSKPLEKQELIRFMLLN